MATPRHDMPGSGLRPVPARAVETREWRARFGSFTGVRLQGRPFPAEAVQLHCTTQLGTTARPGHNECSCQEPAQSGSPPAPLFCRPAATTQASRHNPAAKSGKKSSGERRRQKVSRPAAGGVGLVSVRVFPGRESSANVGCLLRPFGLSMRLRNAAARKEWFST